MWKKALVMLAVIVVAVVAAPTAAHAASCLSRGCDDLSPISTGCYVGGFVAVRATADHHEIQLGYGPACGSAWAYTTSTLAQYIRIRGYDAQGNLRITRFAYANASFPYTVMVSDTGYETADACERVPVTENGWVCTARF